MKKDYNNQNNMKVVIKTKNAITQVDMNSISMIICEGYLSTLHFLNNHKPISVSKLLKDFEKDLEPHGFFRVNRNTIVNIKNVYSLQNGRDRLITMACNNKIRVSFRKLHHFRKILEANK